MLIGELNLGVVMSIGKLAISFALFGAGLTIGYPHELTGQITVSPRNCEACLGDSVTISNQSVRDLVATICIQDNETVLGLVSAGGLRSWSVPDDSSLIGLCIEIKLYDASGVLIEKKLKLNDCTSSSGFRLGDINLDGAVNLLDVSPFGIIIEGQKYLEEGDLDFDQDVDLHDLDALIEKLLILQFQKT